MGNRNRGEKDWQIDDVVSDARRESSIGEISVFHIVCWGTGEKRKTAVLGRGAAVETPSSSKRTRSWWADPHRA